MSLVRMLGTMTIEPNAAAMSAQQQHLLTRLDFGAPIRCSLRLPNDRCVRCPRFLLLVNIAMRCESRPQAGASELAADELLGFRGMLSW